MSYIKSTEVNQFTQPKDDECYREMYRDNDFVSYDIIKKKDVKPDDIICGKLPKTFKFTYELVNYSTEFKPIKKSFAQ